MHGARLKMADGKMTQLRLAASEEFGFLRIKAEIPVSDTPKPLTTSVPIFETALMADDHCDHQLLTLIHETITAGITWEKLIALPPRTERRENISNLTEPFQSHTPST